QLLSLYAELQRRIQELDRQVEEQARQRLQARRLLTHPGVGPVTALATEVFLGDPSRFTTAKQVASYIGMIPREYSSGQRQRLGTLTKQGNSLLRYLWTEAALHAVRKDPELKRFYRRQLIQKGMGKARIAAARKLGIRLWIMLRDQIEYEEFCRRGKLRQNGEAHEGMPVSVEKVPELMLVAVQCSGYKQARVLDAAVHHYIWRPAAHDGTPFPRGVAVLLLPARRSGS